MEKQPTRKSSLVLPLGLAILMLLGSSLLTPVGRQWWKQRTESSWLGEQSSQLKGEDSLVLASVLLSSEQRQSQLEAIAASKQKSHERSRARYLLAVDLLEQKQAKPALQYLQGLEKDYPILAAPILLRQAEAYELMGKPDKARQIWQKLLKNYPHSPAIVEAFYQLGKSNSQYWEKALGLNLNKAASGQISLPLLTPSPQQIAQFPHHPRSHEIVRQLLAQNPDRLELLLFLVKYDRDADTNEIRDRLVQEYSSQLKPSDWEAIATGYWQERDYQKAADAYTRSPYTARNAYRIGRGLHLSGKKTEARKAYQRFIGKFPEAEEAPLALKHLASLSKPEAALGYLDQIISNFPQKAPSALLKKAQILDSLKQRQLAAGIRQLILTDYSDSQTAAEYRWSLAQKAAAAGDLEGARDWAGEIVSDNADRYIAAQAGFWVGKWAEQLGDRQRAQAAFEWVLAHHPQSYYAWRSAVLLGWDVGDFNNVRYLTPEVNAPTARSLPLAGSATLKELYQLGQDRDAWNFWQAEIGNPEELSVAEQFSEGLLRIGKGNYLQGIYRIWSLKNRQDSQQQKQWELLRQTPEYWQALFPFAFEQIILNWSGKRQLNPLLVTSLIRQESRFEREIRSWAGAVGLMQLMPATGKWVAGKINLQDYSLINPDDNVNLGTWYLKYTHNLYEDNSMLAVASYNAGPGNVARWMKRYSLNDPDVFVEKIPFRETKNYVKVVFGNYWNYLRIYNPQVSQLLQQSSLK